VDKPILNKVNTIEDLDCYEYDRYIPSAYNDRAFSMVQKINTVIIKLNEIGAIANDTVSQWNTVMDWVENDGLEASALEKLQALIDDGTIGSLINDGLLADVNKNLGSKATQSSVDVLSAQISSLVANAGNVSGNSELTDIRLDSYAKTWSTAGAQTRAQGDFASYTRSMTTDYATIIPNVDASYNWYYDKNTLVKTAHSGYAVTSMYDTQYNDEWLVTTYLSGPLVATAVMFDVNGVALGVLGAVGNNTTDPQTSLIRVNNPSCKKIAFQVNNSQRPSLLARKKKPKSDTIETLKRTKGYYHLNAKPRTGMSDRAQIKLTYDIGVNGTVKSFNIPFEILNNVSGVGYRLFGGLTPTSYEMSMDYYSQWIGEGTYSWITTGRDLPMPIDTASSNPTRYLQVFIDVMLSDVTKAGEIKVPKFKVNGKDAISGIINAGNTGDYFANVTAFAERSPLYQKSIGGMGDSLMNGSVTGNQITWLNKIGSKYDMNYYNYGDNGDTVANQTFDTAQPCMVNRYMNLAPNLDYLVLLGGANDRRCNVPLGTLTSTDKNTFMGALNIIIDGWRQLYPKAHIVFMTNYNRAQGVVNTLGLTDLDYVNAMIQVCANKFVTCYDNYHNSGVNFYDPNLKVWMDEGIAMIDGTQNFHISDECYTWLMPKYEKLLEMA
jgi:hypothetical protein